jgi:hypothetical protein
MENYNNLYEEYLRFSESEYNLNSIKNFKGTENDYNNLVNWIDSLNLKQGKAPRGYAKEYQDLIKIKNQIETINKWYKGDITKSNSINIIDFLLKSIRPVIEDITKELSLDNDNILELELTNANFYNESLMPYKDFENKSKQIDSFLNKLIGIYKKSLNPRLDIYFVKSSLIKSKAKYSNEKDAIIINPSKIETGDQYAGFNYIIVHELGHRYLRYNKVNFNYDSTEWITTDYSKVDSMQGEEKFAELFALSLFNYKGKPFDSFQDKIDKFKKLIH